MAAERLLVKARTGGADPSATSAARIASPQSRRSAMLGRLARSVLATYPRHGVMRGNHRLTFAR
jgi:hypothetical protein